MTHLTAAERGKIEILLQEHYTNKYIARKLGRSPSGMSREIAKGRDGSGIYRAFVAQVAYETNRKRCIQLPKLDHPANYRLRSAIVACIQRAWDPSQTAGRLRQDAEWRDLPTFVCAETIYHWIYTSAYAIAEKLYQYLRYGKKKRTKHTGRSAHRSKIPNRVSIHDRPLVVAERSRLGDWEGDSVVYTHLHAINTVSE
jgi:IS30 family transposase